MHGVHPYFYVSTIIYTARQDSAEQTRVSSHRVTSTRTTECIEGLLTHDIPRLE